MKAVHKSVLYKEALEALQINKNETYVDATVNGGGHTKGILERGGRVLGIDVDPTSIKYAAEAFSLPLKTENNLLYTESEKLILTCGNFAQLGKTANRFRVSKLAGVLFDLGLSSLQLESAERGFSFTKEGPLDMRMDPALAVSAADLIKVLNEGELYELFNKYGEEPCSRRLARAIVQARVAGEIKTTKNLAEIIEKSAPKYARLHPATRVFQALRIAVNDELNNLKKGLSEAKVLLKKEGRLVVISFHSLEDRIVKKFFTESGDLRVLSKKPIVPSREEISENPRSRSAKMRVAEKI